MGRSASSVIIGISACTIGAPRSPSVVEFFVAIGHAAAVTDGLVIFLDFHLLCGVIIVLLMQTENQNAYGSQQNVGLAGESPASTIVRFG